MCIRDRNREGEVQTASDASMETPRQHLSKASVMTTVCAPLCFEKLGYCYAEVGNLSQGGVVPCLVTAIVVRWVR